MAFVAGCHPGTGPIKAAAIHVRRAFGFLGFFLLQRCVSFRFSRASLWLAAVAASPAAATADALPGCASRPDCAAIAGMRTSEKRLPTLFLPTLSGRILSRWTEIAIRIYLPFDICAPIRVRFNLRDIFADRIRR